MLRLSAKTLVAAIVACIAVTSALADRKPTVEERLRIETRLKELGYSSWDEIEFDEERKTWEVEDARSADGKEYDLKLDPQTLDIVSRELQQ